MKDLWFLPHCSCFGVCARLNEIGKGTFQTKVSSYCRIQTSTTFLTVATLTVRSRFARPTVISSLPPPPHSKPSSSCSLSLMHRHPLVISLPLIFPVTARPQGPLPGHQLVVRPTHPSQTAESPSHQPSSPRNSRSTSFPPDRVALPTADAPRPPTCPFFQAPTRPAHRHTRLDSFASDSFCQASTRRPTLAVLP
jgi:hypothetical protein